MICDYKISSLLALNAILILLKSPHPPHDLVLLNVAQLERRPTSPLDHPDSEIHQYCSDNVVQILYIFCTYIAHILYRYCTYIAY